MFGSRAVEIVNKHLVQDGPMFMYVGDDTLGTAPPTPPTPPTPPPTTLL